MYSISTSGIEFFSFLHTNDIKKQSVEFCYSNFGWKGVYKLFTFTRSFLSCEILDSQLINQEFSSVYYINLAQNFIDSIDLATKSDIFFYEKIFTEYINCYRYC